MNTDDTKLVDLSKSVQTRAERMARIYTTEGQNKDNPVVGEHLDSTGSWQLGRWKGDGTSSIHRELDLVNVPQQHTVTGNVYRPGPSCDGMLHICLFDSRDEADKTATYDRIACIEITFTEGEGLD